MAVFIPEWASQSARNVLLRRVLGELDDAYVVRMPIAQPDCPADFFVSDGQRRWLALGVEEGGFDEIDPEQLFDDGRRIAFAERLAALAALGGAERGPGALMLLWRCDDEQARRLSRHYLARYGVRLVARPRLTALGAKLLAGLPTPISAALEQDLLRRFFPETVIALGVERRAGARDNSARLAPLFLDREQEGTAKLDLVLPALQSGAARDLSVRLVNGVAGSGKTLIAVSRALLLARLFPAHTVLLLIHNTPIVADLRNRLLAVHGALPANLEMSTFYAWAGQQWRRSFHAQPRMPDAPWLLPDLVRQCRLRQPALQRPDAQLIDELDFINNSLVADRAAYLTARRSGRGFALSARERVALWDLYEDVTAALAQRRLRMWSALPREICLDAAAPSRLKTYRHIIVDEGQFFAPSWFQLVKLSSAADASLFVCADPNQGFMKSRLSWKSAGLQVAGRTRKLRQSYRTTRPILAAAGAMLAGLAPDDGDDYLEPDFSAMPEGPPPFLVQCDAPQDAIDRLVNEVAAAGPEALGGMLVIYGDNVPKAALYARLARRLGADKIWWLNEKSQKKAPPGEPGQHYLRLAYLDTATGLEARTVFLVGLEKLFAAAAPGGGDEQLAHREESLRKLYMAMTRAAYRLVVIASQRPPEAIARRFQAHD